MQAIHVFLTLLPTLHDDHLYTRPHCALCREERRSYAHYRVADRHGKMCARRVDIDMFIVTCGQAITDNFVAGNHVAEQDDVGNDGQRDALQEHLQAWPANGERRHLRPGIRNRREQNTPLDIVAHLPDQGTYNRSDNEAR